MVTFHGERLEGRYVLFRTDGKNWMIHRMDPPQDPEREPMPQQVKPMLARLGDLPARRRALGVRDQVGRRARDRLRRGRQAAAREPQRERHHAPLPRAARARASVGERTRPILDGEVVAFDDSGRPSFQKLQGRMHLTSEHAVRRLAASDPVAYLIFDLLWLDGHSLMDAALPRAPRAADRARPPGRPLADAGAPPRRRRGAARGLARAGPGGHHRQAPRLPVHARPALADLGQGQERAPRPTSWSAAGCRARGAAASVSAPSWSASTRTASCATPGGSARASTRPS